MTTRIIASALEEAGPRPASIWTASGRVRLQTLVLLRWLGIAGQTFTLLFVAFVLHLKTPLGPCLAVIAASAWINIFLMAARPQIGPVREWEAALQLGYDVIQLALLIAMTGGVANPFMLLFIAPVAVSAMVLRPQVTAALALLAFLCVGIVWSWHAPLPWYADAPLRLPLLYEAGLAAAVLIGLAFTSVYAWRVAQEEERLNMALTAAHHVLVREQRLAALGGLAAAAAHELGTPLATIHLVAKEMARGLPTDSPLREDADLLVSQSERCRAILSQLSQRRDQTDAVLERAPLQAMLEEAANPHRGLGRAIRIVLTPPADAPSDAAAPQVRRQPELIHGLSNLVENAVGFAETEVEILATWTASEISVLIRDDGPGFSPTVLTRLGEPYISDRDELSGRAGGLGLGFFIAKTLLERTGARLEARNRTAPRTGAVVRVVWPRARLAAAAEK